MSKETKPTGKKSTKVMQIIVITIFTIGVLFGTLNIVGGSDSQPQQQQSYSTQAAPF